MAIQGPKLLLCRDFFSSMAVAREREFCMVGFYGPGLEVAYIISVHISLAIIQSQALPNYKRSWKYSLVTSMKGKK